jgi:multiple sugar transport system ATP-binding protein
MGEIKLDNITKRFGDVTAVNNIDITLKDGAYTMIIGPSGCGKSTTLRMIAGLETPSEGDIWIDGEPVTYKPPRLREISMVFQNLALWPHKTVEENMAFGLLMEDVGKEERQAQVHDIAEILQIEDKLEQSPTELSGGQQQRVALGRSLVREPEVILLDEPLSSLDEKLRLEMRTELSRIHQEVGTTFVHVTHNQEDAMSVADQILVLNEGEVQQFGDPLELYHHPANEFVADFVGSPSMNLFDASIVDGPEMVLDAGPFKLPLGASGNGWSAKIDDEVLAGIRPESLRIGPTNKSSDAPGFTAKVDVVETFGDFNWYYLDVNLEEELVVQSADEHVLESVSVGDTVHVTVDKKDLRMFDPRTGEALG